MISLKVVCTFGRLGFSPRSFSSFIIWRFKSPSSMPFFAKAGTSKSNEERPNKINLHWKTFDISITQFAVTPLAPPLTRKTESLVTLVFIGRFSSTVTGITLVVFLPSSENATSTIPTLASCNSAITCVAIFPTGSSGWISIALQKTGDHSRFRLLTNPVIPPPMTDTFPRFPCPSFPSIRVRVKKLARCVFPSSFKSFWRCFARKNKVFTTSFSALKCWVKFPFWNSKCGCRWMKLPIFPYFECTSWIAFWMALSEFSVSVTAFSEDGLPVSGRLSTTTLSPFALSWSTTREVSSVPSFVTKVMCVSGKENSR